jgi:hypothetical protein
MFVSKAAQADDTTPAAGDRMTARSVSCRLNVLATSFLEDRTTDRPLYGVPGDVWNVTFLE